MTTYHFGIVCCLLLYIVLYLFSVSHSKIRIFSPFSKIVKHFFIILDYKNGT